VKSSRLYKNFQVHEKQMQRVEDKILEEFRRQREKKQ
jgi:hypothetical protein